jgi:hypothetical protein
MREKPGGSGLFRGCLIDRLARCGRGGIRAAGSGEQGGDSRDDGEFDEFHNGCFGLVATFDTTRRQPVGVADASGPCRGGKAKTKGRNGRVSDRNRFAAEGGRARDSLVLSGRVGRRPGGGGEFSGRFPEKRLYRSGRMDMFRLPARWQVYETRHAPGFVHDLPLFFPQPS